MDFIIGEQMRNRSDETEKILKILDRCYGVTKEGFYHKEPWQLLVAIMLSAQSTDKQVDKVLPALYDRFPTLDSVVKGSLTDIEEGIRSIGLYKNKAKNIKRCCQQILEDFEGEVPDTIEGLLQLAGVGRKTATLFLADAYGIPGVTVDTHVFRISKRLGWAVGKNPQAVEKELERVLPEEHWNRINFQLIYHGRAVCTARKARCGQCPIEALCPKIGIE